jgi:urocanate hydratase
MMMNPIILLKKQHSPPLSKHTAKGTYFFDYGNAFLEASRAGADIIRQSY